MSGDFRCNKTALDSAETSSVASSDHQRNYRRCMSGDFRCDASLLTVYQRARGNRASYQRKGRTTASAVAEHGKGTSARTRSPERSSAASSASALADALVNLKPTCAENGSCYGDISQTTGRPKTVHVNGYYRSDGTYVRGHYRSTPSASTSYKSAPAATSKPGCAENGSCYGEISPATSRPKTVHVRGYYRKDGTYVRGHYRSRPRR